MKEGRLRRETTLGLAFLKRSSMLTSFGTTMSLSHIACLPKIVFCSIYLNKDSGNDASQRIVKSCRWFTDDAGM